MVRGRRQDDVAVGLVHPVKEVGRVTGNLELVDLGGHGLVGVDAAAASHVEVSHRLGRLGTSLVTPRAGTPITATCRRKASKELSRQCCTTKAEVRKNLF